MNTVSFKDDVLPLKDMLYRLALRITLNRAEAEDIVQDTLIRVWNRRDEWEQIESIEAYCTTVCRNLALDRTGVPTTARPRSTKAHPDVPTAPRRRSNRHSFTTV